MNYDGEISLIPIHTSTRILLSDFLRSWIGNKERELQVYLNGSYTTDLQNIQWVEQTKILISNAIDDLYKIDSV